MMKQANLFFIQNLSEKKQKLQCGLQEMEKR